MWKLILVTNRYNYWEDEEGNYQATDDYTFTPPENGSGGYASLEVLRKLKNDEDKRS